MPEHRLARRTSCGHVVKPMIASRGSAILEVAQAQGMRVGARSCSIAAVTRWRKAWMRMRGGGCVNYAYALPAPVHTRSCISLTFCPCPGVRAPLPWRHCPRRYWPAPRRSPAQWPVAMARDSIYAGSQAASSIRAPTAMPQRIIAWLQRNMQVKDPIGWVLALVAFLAVIGAAFLVFPAR